MPQRLSLVLVALAAAMLFSFAPAQAAPQAQPESSAPNPDDAFRYFPETGHLIGRKIKRFYDTHGGEEVLGKPLTEVFAEDGMQVQYFERARFEIGPSGIGMTRLGGLFTNGRSEPEFQWLAAAPIEDATFFPESGHSITGAFRYFWESRGGVASFGYPISEELKEPDPLDGQPRIVQYFERARFEYHPELMGQPGEVQLATLGRWLLDQRPAAQQHTAPVPPLTLLGKATTGFRTSAFERVHNIARATQMFDGVVVASGQEYSFLNSGDFSENAGFVEGYGIVGGRLERVIGGGLCQVSTTMFRAVSNAGLEITRRQGHSYVVYFYENILGFDATVFSPGVDFRWRNDTPGPLYIAASSDPDAATVTFQIWGTSDGRVTTYEGPHVRNVTRPGPAIWQYDPSMGRGGVKQLVHGRSGMDVNYIRTVRMPNGKTRHFDNFYTHYAPWQDFYAYGPGVTPRR